MDYRAGNYTATEGDTASTAIAAQQEVCFPSVKTILLVLPLIQIPPTPRWVKRQVYQAEDLPHLKKYSGGLIAVEEVAAAASAAAGR